MQMDENTSFLVTVYINGAFYLFIPDVMSKCKLPDVVYVHDAFYFFIFDAATVTTILQMLVYINDAFYLFIPDAMEETQAFSCYLYP